MITEIKEYISFGDFDTKSHGWYLQSREAPSPDEKKVIENIMFSQGVLDFSMLQGERYFENRIITYEFKLPNTNYSDRKSAEREIKSKLMRIGQSQLIDTHDDGFYWLGKCQSVKVKDDPVKRSLVATIEFDCYPFLIFNTDCFDDVWDTFCFERDVAQWTKWRVDGNKEIHFLNFGDTNIVPEVVVDADFVITQNDQQFTFNANKREDILFSLKRGMNVIKVSGHGTIAIHFSAEVMG